ncbi:MFS transporter [Frankia sp. Ag45/Mut15]|uniref:MFS transporter n=2 Tax=Frankia umida TaxID=573489 RepID=A0ABT0K2M4_9ACTN|nr:MFS transporter [Frankia umida]
MPADVPPRRARVACMIAMVAFGLLAGCWAPRIPDVRADLGLSDGALGAALLGAPFGAVATIWLTGRLLGRFASRVVVRATLVLTCVVWNLVPIAGNIGELFVAIALWGAASSALDVALNTQIAQVERHYGRPIMTSAHAAWAGGALLGAGVGSACAGLDIPLAAQIVGVGAFSLATILPATLAMLPTDPIPTVDPIPTAGPIPAVPPPLNGPPRPDGSPPPAVAPSPDASRARRPGRSAPERSPGRMGVRSRVGRMPRTSVALCAMAFGSLLCEGVAADWSALYLEEVTGAAAGVSGLGYTAFSGCMLATRTIGDRAAVRFGPGRLVRTLAGAAAVLFGLALATGATGAGTVTGILGFAAVGTGAACVYPSGMSAMARVGQGAGTSVAAYATFGYLGWLTGPVLVGALSALLGLHTAMLAVPLLLFMIVILAPTLAVGDGQRSSAQPRATGA